MLLFYRFSILVHWNIHDFQCNPENVNSKSTLLNLYTNRSKKKSVVGRANACFAEGEKKTLPSNITGSRTDKLTI